jgi:Tfp pilus assembly protein PilO
MKTSLRQTSWIVALPLAGLTAAYVLGFFLPGRRAIDRLREELDAQREFVVSTTFVAPAIEATKEELKKTAAYNSAWLANAPTEADLSDLHGRIHALAKTAGATTTRFEPQPTVDYERLRRLPILVGCTGSFSQLGRFLETLENLPQTIWVENVEFSTSGQSEGAVKCEVELVVFTDNPDNSDQVDIAG